MDEKKKYSIVGKVEIGTDEYRDLIEDKHEAEKQEEYYRNGFWEEQSKRTKLEEECKMLKQELDRYKKFVNDNGEDDKMALWILRLSREGE